MQICVIGTGFVGVVTAAVFSSFGHQVIGLDVLPDKIEKLKQGIVPFFEPGLKELLQEQQKTGNLTFTTSYEDAIKNSDVIMLAVGTPSSAEGAVDLKYVFSAAESLAPYLKPNAIVAIKSTVPPGTLNSVAEKIKAKTKTAFEMASLPEFLREGTAVQDTLHPDRVVIGSSSEAAAKTLEELHKSFKAPIFHVRPESAQMAKYSANAYLALRIAFINQVADLCEENGADVMEVIKVIGADRRIGDHYWYPGLGYGGSCFPKDVKELAAYSRTVGQANNLLNHLNLINEERIPKLIANWGSKLGGWNGKKVAVLGVAFKPHTDDVRESPALKVVPALLADGATVSAYDPRVEASDMVMAALSGGSEAHAKNVSLSNELLTTIQDADVILALVEWPEIVEFDFAGKKPSTAQWFIDARNQFDAHTLTKAGYNYLGIGRPSHA